MRFHVRTIEQDLRWRATRSSERRKSVLPNALRPPAHKPIVERLMGPVVRRRILPSTPGLQHLDDAADHPAIINPSNAASVRWRERRKPFKLLVGQPKSGAHSALPKFGSLNHILTVLGILLWVPALENLRLVARFPLGQ